MGKIIAVGEILIDLTQIGQNEAGIPLYAANPGGAPANLAVAAARLGADAAFVGKVGADAYGSFLRETLRAQGVDVSALRTEPDAPTTLAVVSVDAGGERSFSFYRRGSADTLLAPEEIDETLLDGASILHFGSVSLTAEPARSATLKAARLAKAAGLTVTYDPNYRANLWPDAQTAIERMCEPLPLADILKVSDEELPLLTGTDDLAQGTQMLADMGIRLVVVTLGADGAFYRFGGSTGVLPGVRCTVADTNGAGDTFFGALLSRLSAREHPLDTLTVPELEAAVRFANRAASLTTSRHGAIPAMPSLAEMDA